MEQKLIFLDIDGTILVPGEGIRQTVQEGLQRARKNGHQVFICTGRSWCGLPEELRHMELDGIIASAGSDIWIHGQNRYRTALSKEQMIKACGILEELDAIYVLEGFEQVYISDKGKRILLGDEPVPDDNPEIIRWKRFFRTRKNVRRIEEWDVEKDPIPKISFMVWSEETSKHLCQTLEKDFYIAFFQQKSSGFANGELISREANKGSAVLKTAELLNADIRNTIAFGDSMNDYQMIEQAACGVVMGNGDEKLKEIADYVCEPVEEDGVIRELERMGIMQASSSANTVSI